MKLCDKRGKLQGIKKDQRGKDEDQDSENDGRRKDRTLFTAQREGSDKHESAAVDQDDSGDELESGNKEVPLYDKRDAERDLGYADDEPGHAVIFLVREKDDAFDQAEHYEQNAAADTQDLKRILRPDEHDHTESYEQKTVKQIAFERIFDPGLHFYSS